MTQLSRLLLAASLALGTFVGTADAQVRGPLSAGKASSNAVRSRASDAAHAKAAAPKARNQATKGDKGRALSGRRGGESAPMKGR